MTFSLVDNLAALVRSRCAQPPPPPSSGSDEGDAGWPEDCHGCGGLDDVACDEFVNAVEEQAASDEDGASGAALFSPACGRMLRRGFSHDEPRVAATCIRLLAACVRRTPCAVMLNLCGEEATTASTCDSVGQKRSRDMTASVQPMMLLRAALTCGVPLSESEDTMRWAAPRQAALQLATALLLLRSSIGSDARAGAKDVTRLIGLIADVLPASRLVACLADRAEYVAEAARELACVALAMPHHRSRGGLGGLPPAEWEPGSEELCRPLCAALVAWLRPPRLTVGLDVGLLPSADLPDAEHCPDSDGDGAGLPDGSALCASTTTGAAACEAARRREAGAAFGGGEAAAGTDCLAEAEPRVALLSALLECVARSPCAPHGTEVVQHGALGALDARLKRLLRPRGARPRPLPRFLSLLPLALGASAPPGLRERLLGLVSFVCEAAGRLSSDLVIVRRCDVSEANEDDEASDDDDSSEDAADGVDARGADGVDARAADGVDARGADGGCELVVEHFAALSSRLLLSGKRGAEAGALRLAGACRPPRPPPGSRPPSPPHSALMPPPPPPLPPPVALVVGVARWCLNLPQPEAPAAFEDALSCRPSDLDNALRGREASALLHCMHATNRWLPTPWVICLLEAGWDALMLTLIADAVWQSVASGARRGTMTTPDATDVVAPGTTSDSSVSACSDCVSGRRGRSASSASDRPVPAACLQPRLVQTAVRSLVGLLAAGRAAHPAICSPGGSALPNGAAGQWRGAAASLARMLADAPSTPAGLATGGPAAAASCAALEALTSLVCADATWLLREVAPPGVPCVATHVADAFAASAAHAEASVRLEMARAVASVLAAGDGQAAHAWLLRHGLPRSLSALLDDTDPATRAAAAHAARKLSELSEGLAALSGHRPHWPAELSELEASDDEPRLMLQGEEENEHRPRFFFGPRPFRHECE